eukprot:scaffold69928_cov22-Prasinocladus_malaysianus.AAC.1
MRTPNSYSYCGVTISTTKNTSTRTSSAYARTRTSNRTRGSTDSRRVREKACSDVISLIRRRNYTFVCLQATADSYVTRSRTPSAAQQQIAPSSDYEY